MANASRNDGKWQAVSVAIVVLAALWLYYSAQHKPSEVGGAEAADVRGNEGAEAVDVRRVAWTDVAAAARSGKCARLPTPINRIEKGKLATCV